MTSDQSKQLKFIPFSSILDPGFWQQLTNIKLNRLKLSKEPIDVYGTYSCSLSANLPCLASLDYRAFRPDLYNQTTQQKQTFVSRMNGKLICTNIRQEFVDFNKKELLDGNGTEIWDAICNGDATRDPEYYLSRFALLVYADLKKYKFIYWFCFPALNYPLNIRYVSTDSSDQSASQPILDILSKEVVDILQQDYESTEILPSNQKSFFITVVRKLTAPFDDNSNKPLYLYTLANYGKAALQVSQDKSQCIDSELYFTFADPSSNASYPGWPLRNYICFIAIQFKINDIKIIRLRSSSSSKDLFGMQNSISMHIQYDQDDHPPTSCPLVTGWEKNETNQLGPRRVALDHLLDPIKLAENAVNLNLKLMKWRLVPNLDLDKISSTRCLLLGCGTLGCHVSRMLLAWGIKNITMVDNSKVSFSNPVRQSLYEFEDCKDTGKNKAIAAQDALKRILPSVNCRGAVLNIPMPGHHIPDQQIEQSKKDVTLLEYLIEDSDVIFLLMDTRESRWLPTVIAMSKQKLVINAAIGFDTFLLQRHGIRDYSLSSSAAKDNQGDIRSTASTSIQEPKDTYIKRCSSVASEDLGCYFCNDVVVPGDSTSDRTLDQQCTVSRPGVSMIVSGLAVELLVATLSHPMGPRAPASTNYDPENAVDECELGIVPHSVRGRLSHYQIYTPTSPSFSKCSACSRPVIEAYRKDGYEFLSQVFDDPNHLEEITGLKDLQSFDDDAVWALTSDDDDEACAET